MKKERPPILFYVRPYNQLAKTSNFSLLAFATRDQRIFDVAQSLCNSSDNVLSDNTKISRLLLEVGKSDITNYYTYLFGKDLQKMLENLSIGLSTLSQPNGVFHVFITDKKLQYLFPPNRTEKDLQKVLCEVELSLTNCSVWLLSEYVEACIPKEKASSAQSLYSTNSPITAITTLIDKKRYFDAAKAAVKMIDQALEIRAINSIPRTASSLLTQCISSLVKNADKTNTVVYLDTLRDCILYYKKALEYYNLASLNRFSAVCCHGIFHLRYEIMKYCTDKEFEQHFELVHPEAEAALGHCTALGDAAGSQKIDEMITIIINKFNNIILKKLENNILAEAKNIIAQYSTAPKSIDLKRLQQCKDNLEEILGQNLFSESKTKLKEDSHYALGKLFFILACRTAEPDVVQQYLKSMSNCFKQANFDPDPHIVEASISHIQGKVLIEKDPDDPEAQRLLKMAFDFYQSRQMLNQAARITQLFPQVSEFESNNILKGH